MSMKEGTLSDYNNELCESETDHMFAGVRSWQSTYQKETERQIKTCRGQWEIKFREDTPQLLKGEFEDKIKGYLLMSGLSSHFTWGLELRESS